MYIIIYEVNHARGGFEERPLAMFRNPREAKVFLSMVRKNGRTAYSRVV